MGYRIRKFARNSVLADTASTDDGSLLESSFIQAFQSNRDQARNTLVSMLLATDRAGARFGVLRSVAGKYGVGIPEPQKKQPLRQRKQKSERKSRDDYNDME